VREREREKKKKEEEKKMELVIRFTYNSRKRIVIEGKSIWVSFQKHNKVVKGVPSRIPISVKSSTFMKNMLF